MRSTIYWRILLLAYSRNRRRQRLEKRRKTRVAMRERLNTFYDLPETEFLKTFRLGKDQVRRLIEQLSPYLAKQQRKDGISPDLKVLIALAFYASGTYQYLVRKSAFYNVSQATVSRAVRQVTQALNHPDVYEQHVSWPMDIQERKHIMEKFSQFGMPGLLGCIDTTHVAIIKPNNQEINYFNKKRYYSLKVMIVCDADLNILCVDAGSPGSTDDSSIWQNHSIYNQLKELNDVGEHVFLLGDSEFPLSPLMMTPIANAVEGTSNQLYNQMHLSAHYAVERCFESLKGRFRCLLSSRALHYDPITSKQIVTACCILHNIANKGNLNYTPLTNKEANIERQRQQADGEIETCSEINPDYQKGASLRRALAVKMWRNCNRS